MLEDLELDNDFVMRLGPQPVWFRYHWSAVWCQSAAATKTGPPIGGPVFRSRARPN
jgi:hypothetical protein